MLAARRDAFDEPRAAAQRCFRGKANCSAHAKIATDREHVPKM